MLILIIWIRIAKVNFYGPSNKQMNIILFWGFSCFSVSFSWLTVVNTWPRALHGQLFCYPCPFMSMSMFKWTSMSMQGSDMTCCFNVWARAAVFLTGRSSPDQPIKTSANLSESVRKVNLCNERSSNAKVLVSLLPFCFFIWRLHGKSLYLRLYNN